jgi:hypothetical protein
MAFQLTVQEDGWHADVFRQGNAYLVVINFGYNAETKTTYSVMIGLEPLPGATGATHMAGGTPVGWRY